MTSEARVQSGLTAKSMTAILYAIFVLQPAIIWISLTTGANITGSLGWLVLIAFAEISRLMGKRVTRQEAAVLFVLAWLPGSAVTGAFFWMDLIYRNYYVTSPITQLFGLKAEIPFWYAPLGEFAWVHRTFFHSTWLIPLGLALVMAMLTHLVSLSMGLIVRQLYVEGERLTFPLESMSASGILALVERGRGEGEEAESRRMDAFWVGVAIALIYTLLLYIPSVMMLLGFPVATLPIPWMDFNTFIQYVIPAASFGIATDLLFIVTGLVIPFHVAISTLIGSVAVYMVGNPLIVKLGITQFARDYYPGMPISRIMERSTLYVWAGPLMGFALAAGLMPVIHRRGIFVQAMKSLWTGRREAGERVLNLKLLIAIWLGATLASVIIVYTLIPIGLVFLAIMLFFSVGWSFLFTLADTRAYGVAGVGIASPAQMYPIVKYSYIRTFDIRRYDIWFMDPVVGTGGSGWCRFFKILDLTDCSVTSFLKAFFIGLPIALIMGLFYVQNFWSLAPIPSVMYMATAIYWPVQAVNQSLWTTGQLFEAFNPLWISGAFIASTLLYAVTQLLHAPISVVAVAAGLGTPIPTALTVFFGAIMGKIALKIMGKGWDEIKMTLCAGLSLGVAVAVVVLSVVGMLLKSLWVMPY